MSGVRSKVIIRKPETFPKTYVDLVEDAMETLRENSSIRSIDDVVSNVDALEIVHVLEDEYGVYLEVPVCAEETFIVMDIVDALAKGLRIKKEK